MAADARGVRWIFPRLGLGVDPLLLDGLHGHVHDLWPLLDVLLALQNVQLRAGCKGEGGEQER